MKLEVMPSRNELRERAQRIAAEVAPRAAETDQTEAYPWYAVELLREARLMGMTIPREYGGLGVPLADAIVVIEELAKACGATARIAVESNAGAIGSLVRYGSE